MGSVVVDSSVLIAFLNSEDSQHEPAVRALRAARERIHTMVLPATGLAESLVAASRVSPLAVKTTESSIDALIDVVHPVDRAVARVTAQLRARHPDLRLPDAIVIAVGAVVDADAILTGDRRWSKVDDRVQVLGSDRVRGRR